MSTTFSEAISRAPLRAFSISTFVICMLVLIFDGMDAQLLGIVAPKVIDDLGTDGTTFGWAASAALVGFGLGSWGGGWLGDTIGRRWSLAIAAAIFSLATVGASWSGDVWQMAAWRLVGGLGFGSAYANAIALASEWLPDRWRSVGVTTLSVGTPAGGVVVGLLAPTLVAEYGWRGSFVVFGVATLLIVLVILLMLRDSPSFLLANGKPEAARLAARKVLDEDIELVPERHDTGGETGTAVGVLDRSNLRLNIGVGISFAASALVAYALLTWSTTMLSGTATLPGKGFTFEEASYVISFGGVTAIIASIATGFLVQWLGSRLVVSGISVTLFLTLLAFAYALETVPAEPSDAHRLAIVVLLGIAAALFSAGIASMYAIMTYAYPPSCRSAGIGFGIFMARVGAVMATAFGGWLLELGEGSIVPFFAVLVVSSVLISMAAFVIDRQVPPAKQA
jgi:AAHS family 4-hydroxybenzoate transporter-like MFS transporter